MFSKKNAHRFSNLLILSEIVMLLTCFFPLDDTFQFAILTIFIVPFVYVIYMAIYYFKKKQNNSSIDD